MMLSVKNILGAYSKIVMHDISNKCYGDAVCLLSQLLTDVFLCCWVLVCVVKNMKT